MAASETPQPIEVVLRPRKRNAKQMAVTALVFACYLIALKVLEDVQTGSWQHSGLRLGLLSLRERSGLDVLREQGHFRRSVEEDLERLATIDDDTDNDLEEDPQ